MLRSGNPALRSRVLPPPLLGSLDCVPLASSLDAKWGKETLPLLLLCARLGIIKSAPGKKRTAGKTGPQTWTPAEAEGVCYAQEDGYKLWKPN